MAIATKSIGAGKTYATVTLWHADAYGGNGGDDCYGQIYGNVDDDGIVLTDATMTSVTLQAAPGEECLGIEDNGARLFTSGGGSEFLENQITGLVLEDFEVDGNGQDLDSWGGIFLNHNGVTIGDVILRRLLIHNLRMSGNDWLAGIKITSLGGGVSILNCAIYDVSSGSLASRDVFGIQVGSTRPVELKNNSICDVHQTNDGEAWGIVNIDDSDHIYKNNVVADCDQTGGGNPAGCWHVGTDTNADCATNASDDSSAPAGDVDTEPIDSSVEFESDSSPWDLSLASGAESIDPDPSTDLGTTRGVNIDITGRDRDSEGDTWDLGAYEYVVSGAISGSTSITFTPTATLTPYGALAGSTDVTFAPTATLTADGALAGSTDVTFTPTGTLTADGALAGSTDVTFAPTGTLIADGALAGSTDVTFAVSGAMQAASAGAMSGTTSVTFTASGTMQADGALSGSTSVTFAPAGTLVGKGPLAGLINLVFSVSGTLSDAAAPTMSGFTSISFSVSGNLRDAVATYFVAAGDVYMAGGVIGQSYVTGRVAGRTYTPGAQAGHIAA